MQPTEAQVIMGIDPGLASTGVAVICGDMYLHGRVLKTVPQSGSILKRIQTIVHDVVLIQKTYGVRHVSIERWAYQGHGSTQTTTTNMLIGALTSLTFCEPFPKVYTHDPLHWGRQLTGRAKRSKSDVAAAINIRLGVKLTAKAGGHLTDAIGLAIVLQDQLKMRQAQEE